MLWFLSDHARKTWVAARKDLMHRHSLANHPQDLPTAHPVPSLVQTMASRLIGAKPLSEPNAGLLLFGSLGTSFSEIWIKIKQFSSTKMRFKMSSVKWRPFCLGLNVLNWICYNYINDHSNACVLNAKQNIPYDIIIKGSAVWKSIFKLFH